ncbi:MAG: hypothetical protein O2904_04785 [bacterium]|nr:hypothetical protein [bacterium]
MLALLAVIILGTQSRGPLASLIQASVDIGIEHAKPAAVTLEFTKRDDAALLQISTESEEMIFISLPSNWQRTEVRNAPIEFVTADAPTFGYKRWHFPPNATVSFWIPMDAPDSIVIHNPSHVTLKLGTVVVDVDAGTVERDIVLMKDEAIKLW